MSISRWKSGSEARLPDRWEAALRGLAVLLGMAFLVGVAACGGDEPEAAVAMEPVATRPVPVASEVDKAEDPALDPASRVEVESAPITRSVSYDEAESAYHDGAYEVAVDLFEAYTRQRPENPWGQYMLGLSAWKAGHLDLAELALTESVALSPNHVKGRVNLARVLLESHRPEEALEHARHAEDVDPTSVQAKRTLARALESSGDVQGALATYEEALWIAPEDAWSLNNMGYLLIQRGRFGEAVGPLALANTIQEGNAVFLNNLGNALEGAGYPVAALRTFEEAGLVDGEHGKATGAAARLGELVQGDETPEVDVLAEAEAFRARLAGLIEATEVPTHGESREGPPSDSVDVIGRR